MFVQISYGEWSKMSFFIHDKSVSHPQFFPYSIGVLGCSIAFALYWLVRQVRNLVINLTNVTKFTSWDVASNKFQPLNSSLRLFCCCFLPYDLGVAPVRTRHSKINCLHEHYCPLLECMGLATGIECILGNC